MLPLYLLAAHLLGDFVFQTRWQAAGKFTDRALRKRHVWAYAVPFIPLAIWRSWGGSAWHEQRGVVFVCLLVLLHFATDSRRFTSTLGDWLAWNVGGAGPPAEKRGIHAAMGAPLDGFDLPPNPWTPIPILIDQALHVCQLAVLGGLFLS